MTTSASTTPSLDTPSLDEESVDLLDALAAARAALVATVDGLTDEQAAATPTVSGLCLGGLVKHLARGEDGWARFMAGDPGAPRYDLPEGVTWQELMTGTAREYPSWAIAHQQSFRMLPGETLAGVLADYEEVAARTAEVVASLESLSVSRPLPEAPWNPPGSWSARRVLAHLIRETAQHAGHADILRESLDGRVAG
jgi:uncharacterized damage-inducible protein DinB